MIKKILLLGLSTIMIIVLSACPDKEPSKEEEIEKIPNALEKTSKELEQIITLLGGPTFDSLDKIEQMKSEQLQSLSSKHSEPSSERLEQSPESHEGDTSQEQISEKEPEQETQKSAKKAKEEDQSQTGEKEGKAEEEDQSQTGEKEGKEEESSSQEGEGESKDKSGEEAQKAPSIEESDTQKPSAEGGDEINFQFWDSFLGIPRWKEENWNMIKVISDGIHFSWNSLQPELLQKGISQTQSENFNTALEALSLAVNGRDIKTAQTAAFHLSQALADFYSYYKTNIPPELSRITSTVTGIHFSVQQNNWSEAQKFANQMQMDFTQLNASVDDNQEQGFKMLELSVTDLSNAVQKQEAVLVMIRTNMVTANIQELNKKLLQN